MNASLQDKVKEVVDTLTELYEELDALEECQIEERIQTLQQIQIYESIKDGLIENTRRPVSQSTLYFDN
jgi:hypothetical protein